MLRMAVNKIKHVHLNHYKSVLLCDGFPSAIMVEADAKMSYAIYISVPKGNFSICKSANKQTIRLRILTVQTGFTDSLVRPTFLYDTLPSSAGVAALSACGVLFWRAVLGTHQQLKRHKHFKSLLRFKHFAHVYRIKGVAHVANLVDFVTKVNKKNEKVKLSYRVRMVIPCFWPNKNHTHL